MSIEIGYGNARKFHWALGLIAAGLLGSLIGQTASAGSFDAVPTIVVTYDARSLTAETGVRALYRRLESAAHRVCDAESNRDLTSSTFAKDCREAALDRAVRQINNSRLAEIRMASAKRG